MHNTSLFPPLLTQRYWKGYRTLQSNLLMDAMTSCHCPVRADDRSTAAMREHILQGHLQEGIYIKIWKCFLCFLVELFEL